ncbi:MAG: sigma-70 family RNA polymerase sigma factor [Phycisphaerae bacterium]|nr:sigma-70 family RNA polymerase sigma factor [Phycisphaerae bacterium]
MAKPVEQMAYGDFRRDESRSGAYDDLVVLAKTQAAALGRLYELYYDRIFRFCVHRLFNKATAEDVTSSVFLTVARTIRDFKGRTEQDFRSWIYTIAANQANAHIRKTMRRKRLMDNVMGRRGDEDWAGSAGGGEEDWSGLDWPTVYAAIQTLKPEHQTILTLRFFENMDFDEIGRVVDARPATIRVTLHRTLRRLQEVLRGDP